MLNQKDISTWNTSDISAWLKSINMTQYVSKFELNKINGYDLIYLTKEDIKNLGIVNIHDKNVILNSMKKALLQQLKINVNYKNKFAIVQLDFDPNFTVGQLIQSFKSIFKPSSEIFLMVNNNEILMPNLKIVDLILFEPKTYKNFKIVSDEIDMNINNYNNIYPMTEDNKKLLTKTPNKNLYKDYYNLDKEYKTVENINNNKYNKNSTTFDNLENLYSNKMYTFDKKALKKYSSNINNNTKLNEEYYSNYKTYDDYNKLKEIKKDNNSYNLNNSLVNNYENKLGKEINIDKNKLYEYNNMNNLSQNNLVKNDINNISSTTSAYRKNYSIKNGELNLDIKNINLNKVKKEEDDGLKYSSEKRNYRLKEINLNGNYNNNLNENNNFNYDSNTNEKNYIGATGGFI